MQENGKMEELLKQIAESLDEIGGYLHGMDVSLDDISDSLSHCVEVNGKYGALCVKGTIITQ